MASILRSLIIATFLCGILVSGPGTIASAQQNSNPQFEFQQIQDCKGNPGVTDASNSGWRVVAAFRDSILSCGAGASSPSIVYVMQRHVGANNPKFEVQ
jgi:hypothetical protein